MAKPSRWHRNFRRVRWFSRKLMSSVGDKEIDRIIENLTNSKTLSNLYTEIIDSPVWLEYTLGKASLYPHQTNAVQETLSSWPMRNLFADEVGLGKTLEVELVSLML